MTEHTKETEPFNYFLKDGVACDPEEEYGFEASYYIDNGVWSGLYTNFVGLHYIRFNDDDTVTVLTNYSIEPSEDFKSKGWRVRSFAKDQYHFHFPRMDLDVDELEFTREFVRTEWPSEMAEETDHSMPIPVPYEDYIIEYDATLVSGLIARHLDALLEDLNDMAATDTNNCPPPDHPIVKASQRKLQHLMETRWIFQGHAPLDYYSDEEGQ